MDIPEPKPTPKPKLHAAKGSLWPWIVAFIAIEALVAWGVVHSRSVVMTAYDTPKAQADWNTWKADAKKMGEENTGLITRREPKAIQPPGLILMRDYFPQILVGSLALSGVLLGMTMLMAYGVVNQSS